MVLTPQNGGKRAKSAYQKHEEGECGCTPLVNPLSCPYQVFLDGWEFTTDVGNGQSRGEIFTPRFIVDDMITKSGVLTPEAVYQYDYEGSQTVLRKTVGRRVFEPAVGTGNFTATILWHKLEHANALTNTAHKTNGRSRKTPTQLRRYQTYTLVALASMYFNDIDVGNLQTTKWRIFRDGEINTETNINFWTQHIINHLTNPHNISPVDAGNIQLYVKGSIETAGTQWGAADEDRGVLDVLYKKHTNQHPPEWLRQLWKTILDENGKPFNTITENDSVINGHLIPGYRNVDWTFWWFNHDKDFTYVAKRKMPLQRQLLTNHIKQLEQEATVVKNRGHIAGLEDGVLPFEELGEAYIFADENDEKLYNKMQKKIIQTKSSLKHTKQFGTVEMIEIPHTEDTKTEKKTTIIYGE